MEGKAVAKHNHCVDYHGIDIDVKKSNVQKAIRRGLFIHAACSFFAGYNLLRLFPNNKVALATQTNFINRLIVIAVEDIGLANIPLVRTIIPVLFRMSTKKETRDEQILCTIISLMCESKKSRLCSHLFHAYTRPEISKQYGLEVVKHPYRKELDRLECFQWTPEQVFSCMDLKEPHFQLMKKVYDKASKFGKPNVLRYMIALHYFLRPETEFNEMRLYVQSEWTKPCIELLPFTNSLVVPLMTNELFIEPLEDSVDVHTKKGRQNGSDKKTISIFWS